MRNENHRRIEAVLFAVGRDIAVEEISGLCGIPENEVGKILRDLKNEYNDRKDSALALHEKGKFWKFSVKDAYLPLITNLVQNTELDKSVMETLAVIAWRYPILQADLVKIRHNKAYDHLKMLEDREFIAKEKIGRTFKIKLTQKFFDYFDLPSNDAKEAFKRVIPTEIQKQIAQAEEDIEEIKNDIKVKSGDNNIKKNRGEGDKKGGNQEKSEEEMARDAADALEEEIE